MDAREMAMGEASLPRSSSMVSDNFAYSFLPDRVDPNRNFTLPLPLGAVNLLRNPPVIDPKDPGFDPIVLLNILASGMVHVPLVEPDPLDGDLVLNLGMDHLSVYWEDAKHFIPKEALGFETAFRDPGLNLWTRRSSPRSYRLRLAPLMYASLETQLDDAFYGILAEGDPLLANSVYGIDAHVRLMGGLSWTFGAVAEMELDEKTKLHLAFAPKLLTGLAFADSDIRLRASTADTLFSSDNPMDLDLEALSSHALPGSFSSGFGLDLGVVLRGEDWDLGLGVQDLFASVHFPRSESSRSWLAESEEEEGGGGLNFETETLASDEAHDFPLSPSWTLNAALIRDSWMLLGDVRVRESFTSAHLGGEKRFGPLALRAGIRNDYKGHWQPSGGIGLRRGRAELSLALAGHSFVQDEQGLVLAMSLNLYKETR
jgi:hypothetical protein